MSRPLYRLCAIAALCVAVVLPRVGWDVYTNGSPAQKSAARVAVADAHAIPELKPAAVAAARGNETLAMAAHGVPLRDVVFAPHAWLYGSVLSLYGVYGYMDTYAAPWVYVALVLLSVSVGVLALFGLRRSSPDTWAATTTVVLGSSVLVVASSLLLSWVDALQAQGRYVFPIFPLLALLLVAAGQRLPGAALRITLLAAFACSAYSFACVALPHFAELAQR